MKLERTKDYLRIEYQFQVFMSLPSGKIVSSSSRGAVLNWRGERDADVLGCNEYYSMCFKTVLVTLALSLMINFLLLIIYF